MKHPWNAASLAQGRQSRCLTGKLSLVSILTLALFLILAPTALATSTWYVNGVNGSDSNNCKTPLTACKTISHAISLASPGDTISVAAATYSESLTILFSLTINGAGARTTIIDGGGVNTVVSIPGVASTVLISRVTIRNGFSTGKGAGISNVGNLTLNAVAVVDNVEQSSDPGEGGAGGIYNTGTLTLNLSVVEQNSGTYGAGGIYSPWGTSPVTTFNSSAVRLNDGGGLSASGTVKINHSHINNNTGRSFGGLLIDRATLTVTDSTVSGNRDVGRLIYAAGGGLTSISGSNSVSLVNSYFSGNTTVFLGGGIYMKGGQLVIDHTTIVANGAEHGGGGIAFSGGMLTITASTVAKNTALPPFGNGGGIDLSTATALITDTAIISNTAYAGGGIIMGDGNVVNVTNSTLGENSPTAIENWGVLSINNTTITGNATGIWSGPYDNITATLQNTILSNTAGNCAYAPARILSNGYNLSSDGSCIFNNTGDLNNTDPVLGPLQNNGGPTSTQALLPSSPAIDAGNPNGCTDGNGNLLTTDQRGYPRPDKQSGICDMGAYELQI